MINPLIKTGSKCKVGEAGRRILNISLKEVEGEVVSISVEGEE